MGVTDFANNDGGGRIDGASDSILPELLPQEVKIWKQFEASKRDRRRFEGEWQSNEASLFDIGAEGGALRSDNQLSQMASTGEEADIGSSGDPTDNFMGINLSARNMQLIHSQLVSNTPVVMAIPTSNEQQDIDSAKCSEMAAAYGRKQYSIDNAISLQALNTFTYGIGFIKQIYDKNAGIMVAVNGQIHNLGDHVFTVPSVWDIYVDANAKSVDKIAWMSERLFVDFEEAIKFFGEDLRPILALYRVDNTAAPTQGYTGNASLFFDVRFDAVEVFERWETGTEANNYKGKLIYHMRDGRILKQMENPCQHPVFSDSSKRSFKKARLPYSILTYEDIPNTIYGRSPAAKCGRAQSILNACYMIMLQTAQNMGVPHLVVNKSSLGENPQNAVTNNSINIIPLDLSGEVGGTMPFTLQAANTSGDLKELIINCTNYINEAWGVNDALLGKQQRETQGITMQISIMQGNMIRERFFNKFIYNIEDVYNLYLSDAAQNWPLNRIIKVIGEDNKVIAKAFNGAAIASGYVVKVERSNVFALDPITRQEQLMNLRPVFLEAGMDPRFILRQLRLADLRGAYDEFDKADNRGKRILEHIKAGKEVTIHKYEDHVGIMGFLQRYVMTEEFVELDEEIQAAIEKQIDDRMAAESKMRLPETSATPPAPMPGAEMGAPPAQLPPMPPRVGPM